MQTVTLYRYTRADGGTDISPKRPETTDYTTLFRVIADEGKILMIGETQTYCADVDDITGVIEVDAPKEETEEHGQEVDEDERHSATL